MRTSKQSVDSIINQKSFAVFGVSRSGKKFGNAVFTEMKKKGYQVYPINPNANEIDGQKCYSSIKELPEKPDALILSIKPEETEKVVREAVEIGVQNVWMQKGSESQSAIDYCKQNNINAVYNECVLMFMEPVESFHKFHKLIWKVFGKLPN